MTDTSYFDFWGTSVSVSSNHQDRHDLEFFYGRHKSEPMERPDVEVTVGLADDSGGGFFQSSLLKDSKTKYINCVDNIDPSYSWSEEFSNWSDRPSPIPPFSSAKLYNTLAVHPGAVIKSRSGSIYGLLGPHYVGKTSCIIELYKSHAFRLVSDSLIVIDIDNREVLTYETPLGFRGDSLQSIAPGLNLIEHRLTVSLDTGLVALVRPKDFLGQGHADGGKLEAFVTLHREDNLKSPKIVAHAAAPNVGWFSGSARQTVLSSLPSENLEVTVPAHFSAAEVALTMDECIGIYENGL